MNKIVAFTLLNQFNPDYALEFVMKVTNTIKTSVCAGFLIAIIVNYGNNKKASENPRLFSSLTHYSNKHIYKVARRPISIFCTFLYVLLF